MPTPDPGFEHYRQRRMAARATGGYHPAPVMAQAEDRRVPYVQSRLPHLAARARDDAYQADALAALLGECYPNATWSN